ncbi:MAG: DNA polymerase domain-containing protein [Promethearchaeota archaeon]
MSVNHVESGRQSHEILGWLFDINIFENYIEIWVKTRGTSSAFGDVVPLYYDYFPSFYISLDPHRKTSLDLEGALELVKQHPSVKDALIEKKFLSVSDKDPSHVIKVRTAINDFKKTIRDLEERALFNFFNSDIPITQLFLYENDLFPMAYCRFKVVSNMVENIYVLDSNKSYFYEIPPLRIIGFSVSRLNINIKRRNNSDTTDSYAKYEMLYTPNYNDELVSIDIKLIAGYSVEFISNLANSWHIKYEENGIYLEIKEDSEVETIKSISKMVELLDPDIILTERGDSSVFPFLVARASANKVDELLYLSRYSGVLLNRNSKKESTVMTGRGRHGSVQIVDLFSSRRRVRGDPPSLKQNMLKISNADMVSFFSYGRIYTKSRFQFYLRGRVHIDITTYGSLHFADGNLEGLIEVSRVSRVPLERLTRITIGGALQSIEYHVALRRGYLIPKMKKNSEDFQTVSTLLNADRGGHIFEPFVGIFGLVGEFDFTSMYPSIMLNQNISPDTMITSAEEVSQIDKIDKMKQNQSQIRGELKQVPGLPFYTYESPIKGIISESLELPLKKRRVYKKLLKYFPEESVDYQIFNNRNRALKWILVVAFGYLGFKNARFGRVEGHQSVCAYARELLLQTKELAESNGFKVIHGIVDSLWLQLKDYAPAIIPDPLYNNAPKFIDSLNKLDVEYFKTQANKLAKLVQQKTNISIEPDAIYKFIVFLPSKLIPSIPVLNRYWGATLDGKIKIRGLELRRRDSPLIIKKFQQELLEYLASAEDIYDLIRKLPLTKKIYKKYLNKLENGDVTIDDLIITISLSKDPKNYKNHSFQAIAAAKLLDMNITIGAGKKVDYIIYNARSKNPYRRILLKSEIIRRAHELSKKKTNNKTSISRNNARNNGKNRIIKQFYDVQKYKELLTRAFQNIIPFPLDELDNFKGDRIIGTHLILEKEKKIKDAGLLRYMHS